MKKLIGTLTAICFLAVNVAIAQTPTAAPATQEVVKTEKKDACCKKGVEAKACCKSDSEAKAKNCTKEQAKSCTPAQKAACNHGDKSKTEATTTPSTLEKKEVKPQN